MTDATHSEIKDTEERDLRMRHMIVDIDHMIFDIGLKMVDMDVKLQQRAMEPWKVFSIVVGAAAALIGSGIALARVLGVS